MAEINLRIHNDLNAVIERLGSEVDMSVNGFIMNKLHSIAQANDPKYRSKHPQLVLDCNRARRRKQKSRNKDLQKKGHRRNSRRSSP